MDRPDEVDVEAQPKPRLLTPMNILCAALSLTAGSIFGVNIEYVPAAIYMDTAVQNCTSFTHQASCNAVELTRCIWTAPPGSPAGTPAACHFSDWPGVNCSHWPTRDTCEDHDGCVFDQRSDWCRHDVGYTAVEQGLLAGAMIVGAAVGSMSAGRLINRFGRRWGAGAVGVITTLANIGQLVAWQTRGFPGLVAARVVLGMAVGLSAVTCPAYVNEMAENDAAATIGVFFQCAIVGGMWIAALILIAIKPNPESDTTGDLAARLHVYHAMTAVLGILMLFLTWIMPESTLWLREIAQRHGYVGTPLDAVASGAGFDDHDEEAERARQLAISMLHSTTASRVSHRSSITASEHTGATPMLPPGHRFEDGAAGAAAAADGQHTLYGGADNSDEDDGQPQPTTAIATDTTKKLMALEDGADADDEDAKDAEWPLWHVVGLAVSLSAMLQLTGVNAIINFFPNIAIQMGMPPVEGNAIYATWSFIVTLASIPMSRYLKAKSAYLGSVIIASVACVIAGIAAAPWVGFAKGAQLGLGIFGILVFVTSFNSGCAPFFYVLASTKFPSVQRELGGSVTQMWQFAFNTLINVGFPVAVQGISGGPSGDQNLGLSTMFLVFAVCGFISTFATWKLLPRHQEQA